MFLLVCGSRGPYLTIRPPPLPQVVNRVVRHCLQTTMKSREFMELYEGKKLPESYRDYPGKMDHTSCVCVEVGVLPRPSALQKMNN